MEVSRNTAAAKAAFEGKTYYFCAEGCRKAFEADPQKYLRSRKA
jgi:YHS domain-containing protein